MIMKQETERKKKWKKRGTKPARTPLHSPRFTVQSIYIYTPYLYRHHLFTFSLPSYVPTLPN